jgi:hypothetical protein
MTLSLQIALFENRKDFLNAFKCLLEAKKEHFRIFDWLTDCIKQL